MPLPDPYTVLQGIHARMSGISRADTVMPTAINSADLPLVVVFPGAGTWTRATSGNVLGWSRIQRMMTVRVFVKPVSQGLGEDEGFQQTLALLTQFGCQYSFDRSLGGQVQGLDSISDTGPITVYWSGAEFWGFEYRLAVWQIVEIPDPNHLPPVPIRHIVTNLSGLMPFNDPPPTPSP